RPQRSLAPASAARLYWQQSLALMQPIAPMRVCACQYIYRWRVFVVRRHWLVLVLVAAVIGTVAFSTATLFFGMSLGRHMLLNELCCQVPSDRNLSLSLDEMRGRKKFPSQIGQDKWV